MNKILEKTIVGDKAPTNKNVLWIDSKNNQIKYNNNNKWNSLTKTSNSGEDNKSSEIIHEVFYHELVGLIQSSSLIPGHVYKLLDYKPTANQPGFMVADSNNIFYIYLTAISDSTFHEESYMQIVPQFISELPKGEKPMRCHFNIGISNKLPYLQISSGADLVPLTNVKEVILVDTITIKGVHYSICSIPYEQNKNGFRESFVNYKNIYIKGKADPEYLLHLVQSDAYVPAGILSIDGKLSPDTDFEKYMEKNSQGNIVESTTLIDVLMQYGKYKGEILWMQDDLGNEAPYDFYNILHRNNLNTIPGAEEVSEATFYYYHLNRFSYFISQMTPEECANMLLTPDRMHFTNNKALTFGATIITTLLQYSRANNNTLADCCITLDEMNGYPPEANNNIVEKSFGAVTFYGSNNIIRGTKMFARYLNSCELLMDSDAGPYILPAMEYCKLTCFGDITCDEYIVRHAVLNGDCIPKPKQLFTIHSNTVVDVMYSMEGKQIEVNRNHQGVFYVTQGSNRMLFVYTKGERWGEWIEKTTIINSVGDILDKQLFQLDPEGHLMFHGNMVYRTSGEPVMQDDIIEYQYHIQDS